MICFLLIELHGQFLRQSPLIYLLLLSNSCIFAFVLLIGLTPDVISAVDKKGNHGNKLDPQLYHYKSGSEDDLDSDQERSTKHASLNVNHQGSQCSVSSNDLDNEHSSRQNGNIHVSRLSISDSEHENMPHRHSLVYQHPHHQPCVAHPMAHPGLHHAGKLTALKLDIVSLCENFLV